MDFVVRLWTFTRKEDGQDLLEYALLVGLIALVAVVAVTSAGKSISGFFDALEDAVSALPI